MAVGEAIAPLFKSALERYSINRSVASTTTMDESYFVPIMQDDGIAPCGENIYSDL